MGEEVYVEKKVMVSDNDAPVEALEVDAAEDQAEEAVVDDPRSAIYKKYDEERRAELSPESEAIKEDEEIVVKVNGKEKHVLRSKVDAAGGIDAYQKNAAASERLNQATEMERKAKEEQVRIDQAREFLLQQARDLDNKKTQQEAQAIDVKGLTKQYHEAFFDGDMEKAEDLFLELQAAHKATPADKEVIAAEAVRRARQEIMAEHHAEVAQRFATLRDEAVRAFLSEDSIITRDPNLLQMVDAKTGEIHKANPNWEPAKIIDEAAKDVKEWVSKVTKGSYDKMAEKRKIDVLKGGSVKATTKPVPKPQTNNEYIQSLRRSRGLDAT
jgi:hypothetical protein